MKKYSVRIAGHATSITLEDIFWAGLTLLAQRNGKSINQLVSEIDEARITPNLSSAVRIYVMSNLISNEQKTLLQDALK